MLRLVRRQRCVIGGVVIGALEERERNAVSGGATRRQRGGEKTHGLLHKHEEEEEHRADVAKR